MSAQYNLNKLTMSYIQYNKIAIVADGQLPHNIKELIKGEEYIICCDGSAKSLISKGVKIDAIVGDMDSLDKDLQYKYSSIIHKSDCQESNDLTKAFYYSLNFCPKQIRIYGATGKREDHTIGNISLLSMYKRVIDIDIEMVTDYGVFIPINRGKSFSSFKGQQISIFSLSPNAKITSTNLKYPLDSVVFDSWWKGTLNECTGDYFELKFTNFEIILFLEKRD